MTSPCVPVAWVKTDGVAFENRGGLSIQNSFWVLLVSQVVAFQFIVIRPMTLHKLPRYAQLVPCIPRSEIQIVSTFSTFFLKEKNNYGQSKIITGKDP